MWLRTEKEGPTAKRDKHGRVRDELFEDSAGFTATLRVKKKYRKNKCVFSKGN